ncbi:DUF2922 domain-containing protein [Clostridium butyricum]|uniref:DUF2922 domain-containing protein n=1 Tax=Clostridium butyricum TaxID=1492 RepID=A0A0A6PXJ9_CLOBU|nr:DUF2922 domain-containing protein [Clostridium butyricum]KHD13974.1 hypothetical protein OA81_17725 [Clostridium butyricum]KHD15199.1 hypothetical protein OA81_10605 [Clostridium butyricum]PPV17336.1 hypothetical protein AWN73_20660 [Clostridium butyricum]
MEYILTLTFMTETGKKNSLTISAVKEDVTSEQANALMDNIIANDIFETKNGAYISKVGAKLTERKITEYTL